MKQILNKIALCGMLSLVSFSASAQTDLLIGHRGNGTLNADKLEYADTTGGMLVITDTKVLTTDIPGSVDGLYGMALEPLSNEMYVVYGIMGADASGRRLGILNTIDATITDIGSASFVNEITFVDAKLYACLGSLGDIKFGVLDLTTGVFTEKFTHLNGSGGSAAMTFDYHNDRILRSCQGSLTYESIDPISLDETSLVHGGHPGWTTTLLTIDENTMFSMGNVSVQLLNSTTFDFGLYGGVVSSEYIHSSAFASYPVSLWVDGSRTVCDDDVELVVVGGGATFEWYFEGVVIAGETSSTYIATEAGEYYAVVDGNTINSVNIEFNDFEASFVISANPTYIGGAASVDVDFFETTSGDVTYLWDSGDGETSTDENPTFTYTAIGDYTVQLSVTNNLFDCVSEVTQVLQVVGGVEIGELTMDFDLFPVPATNTLTINYNGTEQYNVTIYDLGGSVISIHTISTQENNTINIEELASGTYIAEISNGNQVTKRKFVKK